MTRRAFFWLLGGLAAAVVGLFIGRPRTVEPDFYIYSDSWRQLHLATIPPEERNDLGSMLPSSWQYEGAVFNDGSSEPPSFLKPLQAVSWKAVL